MTAIGDSLRWEPGSLSADELDRVLVDALADVWLAARERDSTHFTREFRSRLERAVEHATGVALCGLPAITRLYPKPVRDPSGENAPVPLAAVERGRKGGGR